MERMLTVVVVKTCIVIWQILEDIQGYKLGHMTLSQMSKNLYGENFDSCHVQNKANLSQRQNNV